MVDYTNLLLDYIDEKCAEMLGISIEEYTRKLDRLIELSEFRSEVVVLHLLAEEVRIDQLKNIFNLL